VSSSIQRRVEQSLFPAHAVDGQFNPTGSNSWCRFWLVSVALSRCPRQASQPISFCRPSERRRAVLVHLLPGWLIQPGSRFGRNGKNGSDAPSLTGESQRQSMDCKKFAAGSLLAEVHQADLRSIDLVLQMRTQPRCLRWHARSRGTPTGSYRRRCRLEAFRRRIRTSSRRTPYAKAV